MASTMPQAVNVIVMMDAIALAMPYPKSTMPRRQASRHHTATPCLSLRGQQGIRAAEPCDKGFVATIAPRTFELIPFDNARQDASRNKRNRCHHEEKAHDHEEFVPVTPPSI